MIRAKAGASGLVLTLLWACGGADPEPVAPGVAEDFAVRLAACDAAGYWTVRYQASPPEQLGAHRYPDVLAVTPQGVIVDAIESLSCEAPVAARADWLDSGGCTLRVRAAFGCERRPGENLDLTLTLGSNAAGGNALVEPFDRDDGPWRFAAVAERSHLDTACVVPAPADLPATAYTEPNGDGGGPGSGAYAGPATVAAVAPSDVGPVLTLACDDGLERTVQLAADHPSPPAVGDPLWFDGAAPGGWFGGYVFVLRAAQDGPLITAGLSQPGYYEPENDPWTRAGLRLRFSDACAPAWTVQSCFELLTRQHVALVLGPGEQVAADDGEQAAVLDAAALGQRLTFRVHQAQRVTDVDCTDHPGGWLALTVQPAGGE